MCVMECTGICITYWRLLTATRWGDDIVQSNNTGQHAHGAVHEGYSHTLRPLRTKRHHPENHGKQTVLWGTTRCSSSCCNMTSSCQSSCIVYHFVMPLVPCSRSRTPFSLHVMLQQKTMFLMGFYVIAKLKLKWKKTDVLPVKFWKMQLTFIFSPKLFDKYKAFTFKVI